ncbi:hypothetical protein ACFY15_19340 [Streptomyces sp. NPDC001373]|uniref:hypothetical protein n=1 Tax=Streptomyces sp. NPDC001373 TaxID=3364565 RepID=UPI0036911E15
MQTDWDSRRVPTRTGNSELGWQHFSRSHGITSCRLINAALKGKPDKLSDQQRNLEYWGSAIKNGRQADFVVKVRYAKTTDDGRYEAPGAKGKAGFITAYCRGCGNVRHGSTNLLRGLPRADFHLQNPEAGPAKSA